MLSELKSYLIERRAASLGEIALHFAADPDAVRPMLERWIEKGKVRRSGGARCGGCVSCAPADLEVYTWVAPGGAATGSADLIVQDPVSCRS